MWHWSTPAMSVERLSLPRVAPAEWRANISKATKAAMMRPDVIAKVRCTPRRHLLPPKPPKEVSHQ